MSDYPLQLNIATDNDQVHCALVNMQIDGIKRYAPFKKNWPAGTEPYRVLIEIMTIVSGNLFSKFLSDLIDKHADKTCKINGKHVEPDSATAARIAKIIDGLVIENHLESRAKQDQKDIDD